MRLNLHIRSRALVLGERAAKIMSMRRSSRLVKRRQRMKAGMMKRMRFYSLWKAWTKATMQSTASHMVTARTVMME